MALLSLVLGLVLGAGLALLQQHFGFVGIDAQNLQVNAYHVEVHLQDILLTVAAYAAVSYIVVKLTVRALMRDNI
jgi:lipoprotein-releasing system permease protein